MVHFLGHNTTGRIMKEAPQGASFLLSQTRFRTQLAPAQLIRPQVNFQLAMGGND